MLTGRQIAAGLGIVAAGVCAALPFQRSARPTAAPVKDHHVPALSLRLRDGPRAIPLSVPGAVRAEPVDQSSRAGGVVRVPVLPGRENSLEADVNVPELGTGYPAPTASAQPEFPSPPELRRRPVRPPRVHRVRDGDTLAKIAERYLGDPRRGAEIFELNRGVLRHPDVLPLDATLTLPR